MTKISKELLGFRREIDKIDLKILKLLEERMEIVKEVGKFKNKKKHQFFIKSAREADMINKLVKNSSNNIFNETIISIWRKIITNANLLEQEIKIALCNPEKNNDYIYVLREYFNNLVPISNFKNTADVIHSLEKNEFQIAAFSLPKSPEHSNNNKWWVNFTANNDIKIYAKTSFKESGALNLVLAANKKVEESESDNTLSVIEFSKKISENEVTTSLKSAGFNFKILDKSNSSKINNIDLYLIELKGFFSMESEEIQDFLQSATKPITRIIGYYSNYQI
jgi:chorismate mutase